VKQDDRSTTVFQLRDMVQRFVDQRRWRGYHSPKNLAMALAIEVAELMEHFQWLTVDASRAAADDPQRRDEIGEELADVMCYLLAMANVLNIDVATAVRDKMQKNESKYPIEDNPFPPWDE
jgi:NTP pyrophosphatase (non-canonical NTP hydrolase)